MAPGTRAPNGRAAACAEIRRAYPMLAGIAPSVERAGPNRVYTFRGARREGSAMPAPIVRVTVDAAGRVVRVVASR